MTPTVTAIRQLFLQPERRYPVAEAAALLGVDWREVRGWMESGELAAVDTEAGLVVPWGELASLGMERWSQEVVEEALGEELAAALPELVRLTSIEVLVPRLEVVALELKAAAEGISVSAILARELRDFVSAHLEWLAARVPALAEALDWPQGR
jgi:hypothetical protein